MSIVEISILSKSIYLEFISCVFEFTPYTAEQFKQYNIIVIQYYLNNNTSYIIQMIAQSESWT